MGADYFFTLTDLADCADYKAFKKISQICERNYFSIK